MQPDARGELTTKQVKHTKKRPMPVEVSDYSLFQRGCPKGRPRVCGDYFCCRKGISPKCRNAHTGTAKMTMAASRFQVHGSQWAWMGKIMIMK